MKYSSSTAWAQALSNPDAPACWNHLANAAHNLGDLATVLTAYGRIAEMLANGAKLGRGYHADYALSYGRLLMLSGRTKEAATLLTEAIGIAPQIPRLYRLRSEIGAELRQEIGSLLDLIAATALDRPQGI